MCPYPLRFALDRYHTSYCISIKTALAISTGCQTTLIMDFGQCENLTSKGKQCQEVHTTERNAAGEEYGTVVYQGHLIMYYRASLDGTANSTCATDQKLAGPHRHQGGNLQPQLK